MFRVFLKETNSFFDSLIAYVVIIFFLLGLGLLTWVFPDSSVISYGFADLQVLFSLGPYVMIFLVPAVTMRVFSEEQKNGTLELLFTKPLTDYQIIGGKFLSSFFVVLLSILPTLFYYYSIYQLSLPTGNVDSAGILGSYLGFILLSASFVSIGTFSSSITENQVIAFVMAAFFCFLIYEGIHSMAQIVSSGSIADLIDKLGILYHYEWLSKGVVDSSNLVYMLGITLVFLGLTKLVLESRKW
ncbi:MAG: gliding motility-associated ABC transporter permease subunit GldF [Bacteroidota bacterium]